jgi:hypothetical protein
MTGVGQETVPGFAVGVAHQSATPIPARVLAADS